MKTLYHIKLLAYKKNHGFKSSETIAIQVLYDELTLKKGQTKT